MTTRTPALCLLALLAPAACNEPPVFLPPNQAGGPAGILEGTVTYSGPLPCTEGGHIVGAAVLLAFDARLLPPPDGLGTTAASLAAVPGDTLFGGMVDRLTFQSDGTRWCPPATTEPVTTSASFTIGPLPGGPYEVRGFYDLAGDFDPTFSITKLPQKGDIAGGAIDNVSAVLTGAAPVYRTIVLGTSDGKGGYTIPAQGSTIGGVAVTLGLPLAEGLPVFYPSAVAYSTHACVNKMVVMSTPTSKDPTKVTMPSDYTLPVFTTMNPPGTEDSLIRVTLSAGVPASEAATAAASPYDLDVKSPTIAFSWQDVNHDGMLDIMHDHVAASPIVPSLFPLALFTKLASPTDDLTVQPSPVVILQGLTLYKNLIDTVTWSFMPPANNLQLDTAVVVGLTPAAICIDPTDFSPTATATLVVTHLTDCTGNMILLDPMGTLAQLSAQFGRPVVLKEACLPEGRYATNLVYDTSQAWTVPNEAGVCQALEPESKDGTMCVAAGPTGASRTRLASQDSVVTIGPPTNPAYCAMPAHQVPPECCPNRKCD